MLRAKSVSPNDAPRSWLLPSFLLIACIASVSYLCSPEISRGIVWFSDGGLSLNTAAAVLAGKELYLDVFYPYGPLPITCYVLWAKVFGNSVSSYYALLLPLMLAKYFLLFKVLQKILISLPATMLALLIVSFSALSAFTSPEGPLYAPFEKALSLLIVLLWEPPDSRSFRRGLALGVAIGALQWIRFGTAAALLTGVFLADLLQTAEPLRRLPKRVAPYLASALAVQLSLVVYLFLKLPKDVALDAFWPSFMSSAYTAYALTDLAPRFLSMNYFLGSQLPPLLCGILALAALTSAFGGKTIATAFRLVIPLAAYVFNSVFLYKQVWHFYGGSWLLCLAGAPVIDRLSSTLRVAVLVLLLPGIFVGVKTVLPRSPSEAVKPEVLPNGETLWLPVQVAAANRALTARLNEIHSDASRAGVLFISRSPPTVASHLHFFYKIPQPARHSMVFPGWLRRRDFESLMATLDRSKAIVLMQEADQQPPQANVCLWESHPYPHPYCDQASVQLDKPINVGGSYWIFPLKPSPYQPGR
jgi:hypothetical protein